MHAIVVGGAGFLGSHLVDRLLADGAGVDVIDDLSHGSLANLADARAAGGALKIHNLDAGGAEAASLLGMRRPDVVFHLAALPRGTCAPPELAAALVTTTALLEAACLHRIPKVVVVLPASVLYGRPASRDVPIKERAIEPRGPRGVFARAVIDLLGIYRETEAVEFTVLAMSTVYGPRQRSDGGVVASFLEAARERRSPTITGDGRQTRDLLYVDDAIDALARASARGGGLVINVGTGEQTTLRDLWQHVAGTAGAEPAFVSARPDEITRFAVAPVRARIHLGWSPWTSLADGLASLR